MPPEPDELKVASKHFLKFVKVELEDLIDSGDVMVYMDDILIAADTN